MLGASGTSQSLTVQCSSPDIRKLNFAINLDGVNFRLFLSETEINQPKVFVTKNSQPNCTQKNTFF